MNRSELECARILDYYGMPWDYEPHSFVLERDGDGRTVSAFTPDFYLPEQDLFIEVTVMKQSLVTRKNRKLRELRRLYPEVRVKLFSSTRHRAARPTLSAAFGFLVVSVPPSEHGEVGAVYLAREQIAARVTELGAEIARDYAGRNPILIAPLKSSVVFLADLTRVLPIAHTLDLVELAAYSGTDDGGVRLLKDVDSPLEERHVVIVEDVVDTGLTLHFLCRTLALRNPASLAAVTLLDRPYRRLVEDIPSSTSASPSPTSSLPATASALRERWRAFPDLHSVVPLSSAQIEAA